ncbi:MAG: DUF493 domain-containing protein [Anaerolineae bacterium]|nr:DUF493 domain-containing protein [Anaerolineae bacterium]
MTHSTTSFEFPCSFPLKAFGRNVDNFESFIVAIARKHIPNFEQATIKSRPSQRDKYLAVTITFTATSQAQLDALYREISASERVLMLL